MESFLLTDPALHPAPADFKEAELDESSCLDSQIVNSFDLGKECEDEDIKLNTNNPLVQVAPMLHVTDRHFRYLLRLLSSRVQLWTEMVVDSTLVHSNDLERHLGFAELEKPIVCQLGGSDPEQMARAAKVARTWGYGDMNLNAGCPSIKVAGAGCFGADLAKTPRRIRDICRGVLAAVPDCNFSVKTRISVDDLDTDEYRDELISEISSAGVQHFIMHARPAWLKKKVTPAQNRSAPPLNHQVVFDLAKKYEHLNFTLNGGITTLLQAKMLLRRSVRDQAPLYGTMIGRAVMNSPLTMAGADRWLYNEKSNPSTGLTRRSLFEGYLDYLHPWDLKYGHGDDIDTDCTTTNNNNNMKSIFPLIRPIVGTLHSTPGSTYFRRSLDTLVRLDSCRLSSAEILSEAIRLVDAKYPELLDQSIEISIN